MWELIVFLLWTLAGLPLQSFIVYGLFLIEDVFYVLIPHVLRKGLHEELINGGTGKPDKAKRDGRGVLAEFCFFAG